MHDFNCKDADEMLIPEMAEGTRYLKDTKEGQNEMCDIMQSLVDDNTLMLIENIHKTSGRSYDEIMDEMCIPDNKRKNYKAELLKEGNKSKEKEKVQVA